MCIGKARKNAIESTLSDPLISSERKILQKPNKPFHPDARYLMDLDSVDEDEDNEDSESGSD